MEQARWERLQEIYHQAVALPPSDRESFLETVCAGDHDLLIEARSVLDAATSRGGILDSPVVELGPASHSLTGSTIGERYRLDSELSHGGMSQVYLARDLRLQLRQVVVKVLSPTLIENSYAQKKFDQEVEALLRMEHPGVVRVQDRGELADGRPYIVMAYIDGVSLRSQIPREGMDLERAASIVKQIGDALDHVHENGIFHRDLKPENIMLRRSTDSVVLIDFGIAKIRASVVGVSTVSHTTAGTLPYMSPEQLRGENITPASDVYSMAIVAYEMVTGRRPFNPASPPQLLEMQRAGIRVKPRQLRENLSAKADDAIIRALRFEPTARYRRAGEFGDELNRALRGKADKPFRVPTWAKIIVALIVTAGVSYGVYKYIDRNDNSRDNSNGSAVIPTPTATQSHTFTYFLTVQRMRDGKAYQQPYTSNGQEDIFDRGDRFQLNISAAESGFLYVFNEGPAQTTDGSFTMIYPNRKTNAAATIGANQAIQTDWITFRGPTGDENVWIVWSILPIPELEDAKAEALNHPHGELTGDRIVSTKAFLQTKKRESNVKVRHYKAGPKAVANGDGAVLVYLAQFKHH